jgi:transposase
MKKGAWANIPPNSNRGEPICFSPYLYRARNRVERFFNSINNVVGSRRATTGLPPTTSPSFNSHRSGYGCASMSPRPNWERISTRAVLIPSVRHIMYRSHRRFFALRNAHK